MKFLKDRLLEDKKITVLLDEVAEGKIKNKIKTFRIKTRRKPSPLRLPCFVVIVLLREKGVGVNRFPRIRESCTETLRRC